MLNKKVKLNQAEEMDKSFDISHKLEEISHEFYKSIYNDIEFSPKNITVYTPNKQMHNKSLKMYNLLSNLPFLLF